MQRTGTKVLPWELQNPDFGGDDLRNLINPIPSLKVPPRCGHTGGTRISSPNNGSCDLSGVAPAILHIENCWLQKYTPKKNRPQFVEISEAF